MNHPELIIPVKELNNGVYIPLIGLGTYLAQGDEAAVTMREGLVHGYRLLDTADLYDNYDAIRTALKEFESKARPSKPCPATENVIIPEGAIRCSEEEWLRNFAVPHPESRHQDNHTVFVTTKVWPPLSAQKVETTVNRFFQETGRSQIDLLLLHWPSLLERYGATPEEMRDKAAAESRRLEAWGALERLYAEGRVRAIGVSNFMACHLAPLIDDIEARKQKGDTTAVLPCVNQIEISPWLLPPSELLSLCTQHGIVFQGFAPLGSRHRAAEALRDPLLESLALKHKKTTANVVLRALLQAGYLAIPKSSKVERVLSNYDSFDFKLEATDLEHMQKLNQGIRAGPDPTMLP
eukprot:Protomagalhaensia_sp_Gyna_25__5187@NODE_619_length_2996_cov_34_203923_g480_i0_p2_GENE_NODE_619_length_2996_cov_34_203923_g480_i0NODE_619_length_2996_cov_34_203923_g480_i0_p2_ORF_typecomplete_len351_score70_30Aldo_ket_red/PF00248_21/0_0012Aldo_ket_red/PF00248_21/2_2e40_NODE_619_length_2996_cov_34_203923_g480_i018672919